jgi:uncharacterized SAM-dependent methyltransferase
VSLTELRRGSRLYEKIPLLPAYYLPRREPEILRAHAPAIAERTRARTLALLGSTTGNLDSGRRDFAAALLLAGTPTGP